jgi:hypothetical protein
MPFMVMVKTNERSEAGVMPDHQLLEAMGRYNKTLAKAGILLTGEGLHASKRGARVSVSKQTGGSRSPVVVDGPFAEAKEMVGGFWVLDVSTRQEAVEWVKRVPFSGGEEIELRELHGRPTATLPPRKPGTRRYVVLLKADALSEAGAPLPEGDLGEMDRFLEEATASGTFLDGQGLKPSAAGARVRFAGQERHVVDGPFTEAKELIAGYSLIQAASKDEAVAFARRWLQIHVDMLGLESGQMEVRLLQEIEDYKIDPAEKTDGWRDRERRFRDSQHGADSEPGSQE